MNYECDIHKEVFEQISSFHRLSKIDFSVLRQQD